MADRVKLTEAQKRVFALIARGQSVMRGEHRLADKLEARGLIQNGRATASSGMVITYYDLTPAGRALLAKEGK